MTFCRLKTVSLWDRHAPNIWTCNSVTTTCMYSNSVVECPSGANWTPKVHHASLTSRHGMVIGFPLSSTTTKFASNCPLIQYDHFPLCHVWSIKYQSNLGMSISCLHTHRSVSSTKAKPSIFCLYPDIAKKLVQKHLIA